jgi:hypothetical protein
MARFARRVFKLDEDSVITRLMKLTELTHGAWQWVDTAGLRQIQRVESFDPLATLDRAYPRKKAVETAA